MADRYCMRGHDTHVVGRYANNQCRRCKALQNAEKARKLGGWAALRARSNVRRQRSKNAPATGSVHEPQHHLVLRVLDLHEQAEVATPWERESIMQQVKQIQQTWSRGAS